MGFIIKNTERVIKEQFILGETFYREPTPLISFESEETSLECGQQPAKYPLVYMPFLTPLEQKKAAAAND